MSTSLFRVPASRRVLAIGAAAICLGGLGLSAIAWNRGLFDRLPPGVSREQYARAARAFRRSQGQNPERADILYALGLTRCDAEDWTAAAACFSGIPQEHPRYGQTAAFLRGQALMQLNRLSEAEPLFRSFLAQESRSAADRVSVEDLAAAKQFLSLILALELRFEERRTLLWNMIDRREADLRDTLAACFPALMEWYSPEGALRLEEAIRADPQDAGLRAVLSRYREAQGRGDEALELVTRARQDAPDDPRILAAWLSILYGAADWTTLIAEADKLPAPGSEDPALLLRVRGQVALHERKYHAATEFFRLALAGDPANAESHLGLARASRALNLRQDHERHLAAARALAGIQNRLGWAVAHDVTPAPLAEIADLCRQIGLHKECRTVVAAALQKFPESVELQKLLEQEEPPVP